jgi:hypothetical protein
MPDQQKRLIVPGYETKSQSRLPKFRGGSFPEELRINKAALRLAPIILVSWSILEYFSLAPYLDMQLLLFAPPLITMFLYSLIVDQKELNRNLRYGLLAAYGFSLSLCIIVLGAFFAAALYGMLYSILSSDGRGFLGDNLSLLTVSTLIVGLMMAIWFHRKLRKMENKMAEEQ